MNMLLDDTTQTDHCKECSMREAHPEKEQKQSQQAGTRPLGTFICGGCSSDLSSMTSLHQKNLVKRYKKKHVALD